MKYTNGSEVIDVAKGAYESIYKGLGYVPFQPKEQKQQEQQQVLSVEPKKENTVFDGVDDFGGAKTLDPQEGVRTADSIETEPTEELEDDSFFAPDMKTDEESAESEEPEENQGLDISSMSILEMKVLAKKMELEGYSSFNKEELVEFLKSHLE